MIWPMLPAMVQALLSCHYVNPGDQILEVGIGEPDPVIPISVNS